MSQTVKPLSKVIKKRHEKIIRLVEKSGFVTVDEMARHFEVTPQTVRRDINLLDKNGLIARYHGGAGLALSSENIAYDHRKEINITEKTGISQLTAERIPDQASLFINTGTTAELVAKNLINHKRLKIITNNLNVASTMMKSSDFEVIITGGAVRNRDGSITGEATIDFIKQFKVDYGIIGIGGIELDGTLLDFDYHEVRVSRAIIENSRKVFLVTDNSKIGRKAMVRLGHISEINTLFIDKKPPESIIHILDEHEIELVVP